MPYQKIQFKSYDKLYASQMNHIQDGIVQNDSDIERIKTHATPKMFGAVGDGLADDTKAIQDALNSSNFVKITEGKYRFTKLDITKDNTTIEFEPNVELYSDFVLNDANNGYINAMGETDNAQYPLASDTNELSSRIELSATDIVKFNVGDFIELYNTSSGTSTTEDDHARNRAYCLVSIKDITGNVITTNETIPYSFKVVWQAYANKVTPRKNITIIGNNTIYDKMGVVTRGNFFHFQRCYNVKIDGFICQHGSGKAVEVNQTNLFEIAHIINKDSSAKDTIPYGEAISANKSGYGTIRDCEVYNMRRGIDFITAYYCSAINCQGFKSTITTHGLYSRFINFINCKMFGSSDENGFVFGNASYMYDADIFVKNCYVDSCLRGFYVSQKCKNVIVDGCEIYSCVIPILFENSQNSMANNCIMRKCDYLVSVNGCNNITCKQISFDDNVGTHDNIISLQNSTGVKFIDVYAIFDKTYAIRRIGNGDLAVDFIGCRLDSASTTGQANAEGTFTGNIQYNFVRCNLKKQIMWRAERQFNVINCELPNINRNSSTIKFENCKIIGNIFTASNAVTKALATDTSISLYVENNVNI